MVRLARSRNAALSARRSASRRSRLRSAVTGCAAARLLACCSSRSMSNISPMIGARSQGSGGAGGSKMRPRIMARPARTGSRTKSPRHRRKRLRRPCGRAGQDSNPCPCGWPPSSIPGSALASPVAGAVGSREKPGGTLGKAAPMALYARQFAVVLIGASLRRTEFS